MIRIYGQMVVVFIELYVGTIPFNSVRRVVVYHE